jgi:TonB-dependent SusC/RagA subfamily outer membrane receptor
MKTLQLIIVIILLSKTAFCQDSTKINKQTFQKLPAVMEFKGSKGEMISTNIITTNNKCKDCPPPLFIVDGVENPSDNIKNLDPKDIESISILKDIKAIAEYGEKGKNGVVLITSKKK